MNGGRFAFACFIHVTLKKKNDSQFTYLMTYDIFTFKVWFENNLHRSIMKVFYGNYLNDMQQTETRIQMITW